MNMFQKFVVRYSKWILVDPLVVKKDDKTKSGFGVELPPYPVVKIKCRLCRYARLADSEKMLVHLRKHYEEYLEQRAEEMIADEEWKY